MRGGNCTATNHVNKKIHFRFVGEAKHELTALLGLNYFVHMQALRLSIEGKFALRLKCTYPVRISKTMNIIILYKQTMDVRNVFTHGLMDKLFL